MSLVFAGMSWDATMPRTPMSWLVVSWIRLSTRPPLVWIQFDRMLKRSFSSSAALAVADQRETHRSMRSGGIIVGKHERDAMIPCKFRFLRRKNAYEIE